MGTSIKAFLGRVSATFREFAPGQKAVAVIALLALLVGGLFFARWASTPSYAPLFSNLAPADASAIVEQLSSAGTPYELADGGATILVPKDTVYDARVSLSGQGLPAGDETGYSLLDKQGLTASEFRQRVDYQRALEGELTKTLQAIDGVETAIVRLAIPEKDVFADDDGKVTASVLVDTGVNSSLTGQQVQAVVHLVASSIEGLDPEDVTVADATGKVLSTSAENGLAGGTDERDSRTQAFEDRLSADIEELLEPLVGVGRAVVKTTADLDFDATATRTESFQAAPNVPPLAETTTEETYTGTGGVPAGGVLGPDNQLVPNGAGDNQGDYAKNSRTADNPVGKTTEERKTAPGAVRRLNVAVLLDATAAGTVNPNQIRTLVATAAGIDAQRGDTVEVQRQPFDKSAQDEAAAQLAEAKKAEERAGLMSTVKTAGLALLVLLVLGIAWLSSRRSRKASAELENQRAQLEVLRQARELELTARPALEAAEGSPAELVAGPGPDAEAERVERMRGDIGDLVESQPEEVAQLLRGWLADRRS